MPQGARVEIDVTEPSGQMTTAPAPSFGVTITAESWASRVIQPYWPRDTSTHLSPRKPGRLMKTRSSSSGPALIIPPPRRIGSRTRTMHHGVTGRSYRREHAAVATNARRVTRINFGSPIRRPLVSPEFIPDSSLSYNLDHATSASAARLSRRRMNHWRAPDRSWLQCSLSRNVRKDSSRN